MREQPLREKHRFVIHLPRHPVRKHVALIMGAALLLAACNSAPANQVSMVDQSTPQTTVHSLYQAFNSQDSIVFRSLLDPDDPDVDELVRAFDRMESAGIRYDATDIQIDVIEEGIDMVRLRARFRGKILSNGTVISDEQTGDELSLVKKNDRWYLLGYGQSPPPGWLLERTPVPYATPTVASPRGESIAGLIFGRLSRFRQYFQTDPTSSCSCARNYEVGILRCRAERVSRARI